VSGVFEPNYDPSAPADAAASLDIAGRDAPPSYEPASGLRKWLSRDPIGELGGVNLYGMIGNDSINRLDILGMFSVVVGYCWEINRYKDPRSGGTTCTCDYECKCPPGSYTFDSHRRHGWPCDDAPTITCIKPDLSDVALAILIAAAFLEPTPGGEAALLAYLASRGLVL
jgi:hypothetical protein